MDALPRNLRSIVEEANRSNELVSTRLASLAELDRQQKQQLAEIAHAADQSRAEADRAAKEDSDVSDRINAIARAAEEVREHARFVIEQATLNYLMDGHSVPDVAESDFAAGAGTFADAQDALVALRVALLQYAEHLLAGGQREASRSIAENLAGAGGALAEHASELVRLCHLASARVALDLGNVETALLDYRRCWADQEEFTAKLIAEAQYLDTAGRTNESVQVLTAVLAGADESRLQLIVDRHGASILENSHWASASTILGRLSAGGGPTAERAQALLNQSFTASASEAAESGDVDRALADLRRASQDEVVLSRLVVAEANRLERAGRDELAERLLSAWLAPTGGSLAPTIVDEVALNGSVGLAIILGSQLIGSRQWTSARRILQPFLGVGEPGAAKARLLLERFPGSVPMFGGDASRSGRMPGPGPVAARLAWRFATGSVVSSSPAVVDGVVYVGSDGNNVYALDAASGSERWRFATGSYVYSSPAVADGVVYVGSDDSNVYALDAASGSERWRFTTGSGVSSPAVVDGVVYVGSDGNNVYALVAASGSERWRFTTGSGVESSPAVVDGVVYVGSDDSNVYALDAASGSERWRFATGGRVSSSPAVVDGVVYVGSDGNNVYALDAVSGSERWRFATGSGVSSSPAVVDGVVYVGSDDNNVYALDAVSGRERWRFATGSYVSSSPAVVDGVVYVGSYDNNVYALDAVSGSERWRFATGSYVYSSPAVVDGVVFVGNGDGHVYAIGGAH